MTTTKEMLEFLEKDPHTLKAFQKLVDLARRNSLGDAPGMEELVLKQMIQANCYENMQHTKDFIIYHYRVVKRAGPVIKMPRGFGDVRG